MWLFTETGFVSAVTHRDDSSLMMVRARDKKSLEPLAAWGGVRIENTPTADYPWRVVVPKTILKEWMNNAIDDAEYDNFKSRVTKTRGLDFVDALHDVWAVMQQVEETRMNKKNKANKSSYDWDKKWWLENDEDLDAKLF